MWELLRAWFFLITFYFSNKRRVGAYAREAIINFFVALTALIWVNINQRGYLPWNKLIF